MRLMHLIAFVFQCISFKTKPIKAQNTIKSPNNYIKMLCKRCDWLPFAAWKAVQRGQCSMHENKDYLKVEHIKRQDGLDPGCLLSDPYGFCNRHNFGKKKETSSCFKSQMYSFLGCSKNMYRPFPYVLNQDSLDGFLLWFGIFWFRTVREWTGY